MLQWWIYVIIHLTKPIEYIIPRVDPNIYYGFGMIMMYQSRSLIVTNVPLWCRIVIVEEIVYVWEERVLCIFHSVLL